MRSARGLAPLGFLPALLLAGGCFSSRTSTAPEQTSTVSVIDFAFSPVSVVVPAGTTVTWTNTGKVAHTSTGADWDSGALAPGASFAHAFPVKGTFAYHCAFHANMTATVTVQ